MSYQKEFPDEVIDAEYVEVAPVRHSAGMQLLPRRTSAAMSKIMAEAMVLATHDHCLAMLAKSGMEHIAVLSVMEQQFTSIAPQGAARYREIVDAYAQAVADKVRRW